jgi:hypothetical protein
LNTVYNCKSIKPKNVNKNVNTTSPILSTTDFIRVIYGLNYPVRKISRTMGESTDIYFSYAIKSPLITYVNIDNIGPRSTKECCGIPLTQIMRYREGV